MEKKVILKITKEDLAMLYFSYRYSYHEAYTPQCIEIQEKLKKQKDRIDKLIVPLIKD